jgi:thiamine-phosphate pyrophosphorylase
MSQEQMKDFGLYVIITEPVLSYEEIAEICVVEEVTMLQLREKNLSDRELLAAAQRVQKITAGTTTNFIINDRPDIAYLSNADGYHLGQDDLPLTAVRKIFPHLKKDKKMLAGLSTHNLSQLEQAIKLKPDYLGFGPVYNTPTKANPDPVVEIDLLKQALRVASVPVVAIGGIDATNIDQVLAAGAKNVALVRYFMQSKNLQQRIKHIKSKIQTYEENL